MLTNSSLTTSLEFNTSLEQHFYVLTNLDNLISHEDFFFFDVFEKHQYNYKNSNLSKSLLSNLGTKTNNTKKQELLFKLLTFLKRKNIRYTKSYISQILGLNVFPLHDFIKTVGLNDKSKLKIIWKLSNKFIAKNLQLTNFNKFKQTKMEQLDKFNLDIEAFDCDDYVFRLYENYNSSEFINNSTTFSSKLRSNYRYTKRTHFSKFSKQDKHLHTFTKNRANAFNLYSHYFSLPNLLEFPGNVSFRKPYTYVISKHRAKNFLDFRYNKTTPLVSGITQINLIHELTQPFLNIQNYKRLPLQKLYYVLSKSSSNGVFYVKPKTQSILNFNYYYYTNSLASLHYLQPQNQNQVENTQETAYNIISNAKSSFIIQHIGLFLHFKLFWFKPKFENFKFKFKKIVFSFYKTNELKKTLMENRKNIFIFKYIDSKSLPFTKRVDPEYFNHNLNLDFYLKKKLELRSLNSANFYKTKYVSNFLGYDKSTMDMGYTDTYKQYTLDSSGDQTDIQISRLRFNPGYQRLWREYRLALANAIHFRYIYQRQLTRHLVKFYGCLRYYNVLTTEYKAWKIIIYSRLLPDLHAIKDFIDNSLIFCNGKFLKNENQSLAVNDIIQLQVSVWYYIYYKWLMSWNNVRVRKFKKLVYRKNIASYYTDMNSLKQKSRYTPSYIYSMRLDMSDTKSYLEIDYFTLSFVFIYDNFILDIHSSDNFQEMRHYVYKMYNWKYIN